MSSSIVLLIAVLPVALFVLWPLFVGEGVADAPSPPPDSTEALENRKRAAYAAIKEAEFDQRTGKLSDEDYDSLVARYKNQALEAIVALQAATTTATGKDSGRGTKVSFCGECGTKAPKHGKYCPTCGTQRTKA